MPAGRSIYQRRPGRFAKEKKEFRSLIEKLKRLATKKGYTKKQLASELGVSLTAVHQWWTGYTLTAKRETLQKLKKFLANECSS
jgi:DNA-binding Xre family transcriptional regulator